MVRSSSTLLATISIALLLWAGCATPKYLVLQWELNAPVSPEMQPQTMAQLELQYGKFKLVTIHQTADTLAAIRDSLIRVGVDSLITIERTDNEYWEKFDLSAVKNGKWHKSKLRPIRSANPSYMFWVHNGRYFVQKLDQFGRYPVVERLKHDQAPLYDFYEKQKEALDKETILHQLEAPDYEHSFYEYFPDTVNLEHYPDVAGTRLVFYLGKLLFSGTYVYQFYQPQMLGPEDSQSKIVANNDLNYFRNQMLKQWLWLKLIDSELYEIEMLGYWD
jgi:hypothetical protein